MNERAIECSLIYTDADDTRVLSLAYPLLLLVSSLRTEARLIFS